MTIRLAYLTGYLSPHLQPLLEAAGKHPGFHLRVWYCQGDTALRGWEHGMRPGHPHTISSRRRLTWLHPEFHLDPSVRDWLREEPTDLAVISDYSIPTLRLAMGECRRLGLPWALMAERPFLWQASAGRALAGLVLRRMPLGRAAGVIGIGELGAQVFRELVSWETPVHSVPYFLDASAFGGSREEGLARIGGAGGWFTFLYSGALIPRKGCLLLADAFRMVAGEEPGVRLVVMGDGPQRSAMVRRLGEAASAVTFLGNVPYESVPSVYRAADAFVFPTRHDGWGMAVNEAMASGLPVIATTTCGSARDLVREGENGWLLERWDVAGFVDRMLRLVRDPQLAGRMGAASLQVILGESPGKGAQRLHAACRDVLARAGSGGPRESGGPTLFSFGGGREDGRALVARFHRILRREVTGGNPGLTAEEQALLREHYPVMMSPDRHPPGLVEEIYVGRRTHSTEFIASLPRGARVLDAGCGFGSESFLFASLGARVVAVDRSPEQVEVARKRLPWFRDALGRDLDVAFQVADLEEFEPQADSLDLTWLASVLAAIRDQERFLRRIHHATRPGGRVMVTDMNLANPLFLSGEWLRRRRGMRTSTAFAREADFAAMLCRRGRRGARYFPADNGGAEFDDVQFFTAGTLRRLLATTGFDPCAGSWQGYVPPEVYRFLPGGVERGLAMVPLLRTAGYFYLACGSKS
jgi:glycosyltransferase involved in cell wall biosynthesis/SAM-dependent methyltransferase